MSKGKEADNTLDLLIERALEISIEQRSKYPTLKGKELEALIYRSIESAAAGLQGKKDIKFDKVRLHKKIIAMHLKIIDEFVALRLQPVEKTPEQWEKLFKENVLYIGPSYGRLAREIIHAKEKAQKLINAMGGEDETKKNLTELPEFIFRIMDALTSKLSPNENLIVLKELCQRANLPLKLPETFEEAKNTLTKYSGDVSHNNPLTEMDKHDPDSSASIQKKVTQFFKDANLTLDKIFTNQYDVELMLFHLKHAEPNDMVRFNMLKYICQQMNIDHGSLKTLAETEQRLILHALKLEHQRLLSDQTHLSQTDAYTAMPELNQRVNHFCERVRRISRESLMINHSLTASLLAETRQLEDKTYDLISKASKLMKTPTSRSPITMENKWVMANTPSSINKQHSIAKTATHRQPKGISTAPRNRTRDH